MIVFEARTFFEARTLYFLGPSWGHLGAILAPPKGVHDHAHLLGLVLEPSWDSLGTSWGPPGTLVGPSLGHLGAILEPS